MNRGVAVTVARTDVQTRAGMRGAPLTRDGGDVAMGQGGAPTAGEGEAPGVGGTGFRRSREETEAPMRGRWSTDREAFLAELARAYYEQDLTQAQIAELHEISRSQVSRYLRAARDEGIVQIRIVAAGDRDPELEEAIGSAFPRLREVAVARVFDRQPRLVRRAVARVAARLLDRLARPGQTVCLGAGRTLALVAGLLTRRPLRGAIVVPATGNAGHAAHESDYNAVTHAVAAAWGALAYGINAPAILGRGQSAAQLERTNPQILEALSAARHADLYVLGLGSLAGDEIFVRTGLISADELAVVRSAGAVGDLCGNFFDEHGNGVPGPFADRVVGIGLAELRGAGLSMACAGGDEKVPAIVGALRGRLVDCLVTDEHTARGVLDVVDGRWSAVGEEPQGSEGG
jgi:DNA-binding transcriptional regulator LsrR (DeoR family)